MENTWLQSTTVTLFVSELRVVAVVEGTEKKRPRLAERLPWPLRECKRKEESVAGLKGKKDKCGG